MPVSFLPKKIYNSLPQISPQDLIGQGISLLMLDFDNTIIPYTTNEPTEEMKYWLQAAKASQLQICVVSNSKNGRVLDFCKKYDIPCVTRAKKPGTKGIKACMTRFDRKPGECALVGDQIYTDVLGANRAGITSILVPAIHNHNFWLRLRHILEQPWIIASKKRRVKL